MKDANGMMGADHLGLLLALARLQCPETPLTLLHHPASLSAAEKQALLPTHTLVQKSVTVTLGDIALLVSGGGDFHLSRALFRVLGAILRLPAAVSRKCSVNPPWLEGELATGLAVGMISPFFPPKHAAWLPFSAVVLLDTGCSDKDRVAISLSLEDSLVVPAAQLNALVQRYAQHVYPHIPVVGLPYGIPPISVETLLNQEGQAGGTEAKEASELILV